MRTTITLDKDVAARIERLRKDRPFKKLINDALRAGLEELERGDSGSPRRYAIRPVKGEPRRANVDNVAEVIAEVEGDRYR